MDRVLIGRFLFRYRGFVPVPFLVSLLLLSEKPWALYSPRWLWIGALVTLLGEALRFLVAGFAKGKTSGRGSSLEADFIVRYGLYSYVRNPLYLGNYLLFLGFLLFSRNLLLLVVGTILFALYYSLIVRAEEDFLLSRFPEVYEEYLERVPRFFPALLNKPLEKAPLYSPLQALFREKDTLFQWLLLFFLFQRRRLENFTGTHLLFLLSLVGVWALLSLLKKRFRLRSPG